MMLYDRPTQNPNLEPHAKSFLFKVSFPTGMIFLVGLSIILIIKTFSIFTLRINSDEPQHLHIVWNITRGLVQYRDFFDNHTPFFHFLMLPFLNFWLLVRGEDAFGLLFMRMVMLILYFLMLLILHRINIAIFPRRLAIAAMFITAFFPSFFLVSTEFRSDNLWALLWLGIILIYLQGRSFKGKSFLFALLLGASFATSMKTIMPITGFVLVLLTSEIMVASLLKRRLRLPHPGRIFIFLFALLLVPCAIIAYFCSNSALSNFYSCAITHNLSAT